MTKVRFNNDQVDVKSFTEADFTRHGVTNQGAVTFNAKNDFTNDLSPEAFELLKGFGEPFVEVSDAEQGELELEGGDAEDVPYTEWSKSELQAAIDERNVGRSDEDKLRRTGTIAELADVLTEDDSEA